MSGHDEERERERWRPVVSFDGVYATIYHVSDRGRVRSVPKRYFWGGRMRVTPEMSIPEHGGRVRLSALHPDAVVADLVHDVFVGEVDQPGPVGGDIGVTVPPGTVRHPEPVAVPSEVFRDPYERDDRPWAVRHNARMTWIEVGA